MSNAETIAKLNDALSKLIKAYEELQEENNGLNKTIEQLETKVDGLQEDKKNLENELGQLNQNKKEDGSSITTMLGKIENLLGRKSSNVSSKNNTPDTKPEEIIKSDVTSLVDNIFTTENTTESTDTAVAKETNTSTSSTNLEDIKLSKNEVKPTFGNPNSNTFGSSGFNSSNFPIDDNKKENDQDNDDNNNDDNKLDLNRMASLLSGMNKR